MRFISKFCLNPWKSTKYIFIVIPIDSGCHGEETVLRPKQPATDHKDKDHLHYFW